jgi:hypothetical protein
VHTHSFVSDSQASFETADGLQGEVSVGGSTAATPAAAHPQQWQLQQQQLGAAANGFAPMMPDMSYWSSKVQSTAGNAGCGIRSSAEATFQ